MASNMQSANASAGATAFDSLAANYDRDFSESVIAQHLRGRVHARLDRHFQAGDHVLDLGCGTGEDALYLAGRGVRVTATDVSEAMLAITRAKAADNPLIRVDKIDLRYIPSKTAFIPNLRGVIANFGVVNCLKNWRSLAAWLAEILPAGGIAGFGVMSPLCLWEIGWHGANGEFGTAVRRLRGKATFHGDNGAGMTIRYPTIRRLTQDFAPEFRRIYVAPLGLALPPSDLYAAFNNRQRTLANLTKIDQKLSTFSQFALFADHYWIEFERRAD